MDAFPSIEDVKTSDVFFQEIKIISRLFMHHIEINNLDEITIFLAEAISLCVTNYEKNNKKIKNSRQETLNDSSAVK